MKCPYCGGEEDRVLDSRPAEHGYAIRRRRECLTCMQRFTTYEKVETTPLTVIKKDGSKQSFSRDKVLRGLKRACEKRPVSQIQIEQLVDDIETMLLQIPEKEITVRGIGEAVMERLKEIDVVAYIRFASVYKDFTDVKSFMDELKSI